MPLRMLLGVVAAFVGSLAFGTALVSLNERNQALQAQKAAMAVASSYAYLLQEQLNRSLSTTYALAAVVRQGKGEIDNFEAVAAGMLKLYGGGISALQLARRGVISHVVPLAGNEAAFGHNLLADPLRNKEAFAAIDTRKLTLAGPFPLRQGGLGVVGRLPVFLPEADGRDQFWGFTTAVVKIPDLLTASRMDGISALGYDYELSRINPDHRQREVFARSSEAPLVDPVSFTLEVANGEWQLSLGRPGGWYSPGPVVFLQGVLVAGMAAVVALLAYFIVNQPYRLHRRVAQETRSLRETSAVLEAELGQQKQAAADSRREAADLEAVLGALPEAVVAVDGWGRIRYTNGAARRLLGDADSEWEGERLQHLLELESGGARQDLQEIGRSVIRGGAARRFSGGAQVSNGAGERFSAELAALPVPGSRSIGMVLVFRDLSPLP